MATRHPCICHYVPPHIMNRLARARDKDFGVKARASAIQGKARRSRRVRRADGVEKAPALPNSKKAKRIVYDCKNTLQQRKTKAREEGDKATGDEAVDTVYKYAGIVRAFFKKLGRNSIDDKGMDLHLNVHFGKDYMNAFWDGDEMTFGDGDGQIFKSFTRSLDVVAHELSHGVTQHTANLDYYSESGALNEHFSDVFGSAIQQVHNKEKADKADWLVGDEIMGPTLFGEALRSMKAPGAAYNNNLMDVDPQPAHMRDYYAGYDDNQGVHINSGIPNKAFWRVAYDLGTDKAALIWYQALLNLWPTARFNDAVEVITHAARVLIKAKKVPKGATQTVRLAFRDVGLPY